MEIEEANEKAQRIFEMSEVLDALSCLKRYALWEHLKEMNVAEHSFRVAVIAMTIADIYNSDDNDDKVNIETVLRMGLLHDFEESHNGDIPYPVKRSSDEAKEFFHKMEKDTIETKILKLNPGYKKYVGKDSVVDIERIIVDLADMFDIVLYTAREMRLGNTSVRSLMDRVVQYVEKMVGDDKNLCFVDRAAKLILWRRDDKKEILEGCRGLFARERT